MSPKLVGDLLANLRVERCGPGRPRTRPDAVLADKAYSARGHRALLRTRGIKAVIPEPSDHIRNRKRRGSRGGRPPAFDAETFAIVYRGAAVLRAITIWLKHLERHALIAGALELIARHGLARVADQDVAGSELREPSRCDDHPAAVQFSGGRGGIHADLAPLRP